MQELIRAANEARAHAYAPYSDFKVGAAILTEDGRIFKGCNVENASYGLTICAERVAITNAITAGCSNFQALAVVASASDVVTPCGACRQVISEFCDKEMSIFMANLKVGDVDNIDYTSTIKFDVERLLPYSFGRTVLDREESRDGR